MQRKHPTESNTGRTDSTRISKPTKTIHHEITQPTSIREYGFYTNPNDVTRPKVMNSLYRPQSESVDSTRILVSTKQKPRSKRNQITGNRNHSTEHKSGVWERHASQCNINIQKWSDWYPNGSSKSMTHIVPRKPEKIGRHAKRGEKPKFWKNSEIKTHLAFWFKNPKNPKIIKIGYRMQKRPA